jgi:hypothetical protein
MVLIETICPKCGAKLEIGIDDSCGSPVEAGSECNCGAICVFDVEVLIDYRLGDFLYDERDQKGLACNLR